MPVLDRIIVRRSNVEGGEVTLDFGRLAEAMLYYRDVLFMAEVGSLKELLSAVPPDLVLEFLEEGHLRIDYSPRFRATSSERTAYGQVLYQPIEGTVRAKFDLDRVVAEGVEQFYRKPRKGLARSITAKIAQSPADPRALRATHADYADQAELRGLVAEIVADLAPGYVLPDGFHFEAERAPGDKFTIDTNLDLAEISRLHRMAGSARMTEVTVAHILSHVNDLNADALASATHGGELITTSLGEKLLRRKLQSLAAKVVPAKSDIELFHEVVLENARAVREAINSGERSPKELLALLKESRRFKEWAANKAPDGKLLQEFTRDVSSLGGLETLKAKIAKFVLVSGIGAAVGTVVAGPVGTAAGIALGAADSFVLDRWMQGWKPNSYIASVRQFAAPKK
ncbi:hypothetical protein NR798_16785 [Archangium gephyra]|uniref:hypothetical protein n=1 Tax=Archangium gephyra TaxID=48 RepID=UPI0035D4E9A3